MKGFLIYFVFFFTLGIVNGSPKQSGHLNALAKDSGMSVVKVENDVLLSSGNGGHNFNADSDSNGHAVVSIDGAVRGSAFNREGQEFNAISKNNGSSQVRVNGDLLVENLDSQAEKFDAISETGGQSVVKVGNVQIISGARQGKLLQLRNTTTKADTNRDSLGAPWGAVAVAQHNVRPWEDLENEEGDSSSVNAHVSDIFEDGPIIDHSNQQGLEIHDFPHESIPGGDATQVPQPELPSGSAEPEWVNSTTVAPSSESSVPTGTSVGNLNADSSGAGSFSMIKVQGSVQA